MLKNTDYDEIFLQRETVCHLPFTTIASHWTLASGKAFIQII